MLAYNAFKKEEPFLDLEIFDYSLGKQGLFLFAFLILFSSKAIFPIGSFFFSFSSCLLANCSLKMLFFTIAFNFFFDCCITSSFRGLKLFVFLSNSSTTSSIGVFLTLSFSIERGTLSILLRSSFRALKFTSFFSSARALTVCALILILRRS